MEKDASSLSEQVYGRFIDYGEQLEAALNSVVEERPYFDSSHVSEASDIEIRDVGLMLEGLRQLDIVSALNGDSNNPSKYISQEADLEKASTFLQEVPRFLAERYRRKGLERKEAAERLANLTGFSPATYNSKFTEWGIKFQGHPQEVKEEVLEKASDYEVRRKATHQLAERYDDISRRTIDNWITEGDLSFTHSDEKRAVVEQQMSFLNNLSFPRNYSRELVSDIESVPESTINDWISGLVLFSDSRD